MSPTFSFTVSNSPVRLFIVPATSSSFSHSVMNSFIASIAYPPLSGASPTWETHHTGFVFTYPKRPESRGINVIPMSATPPPATSCFTPCDFAPEIHLWISVVVAISFQQVNAAPYAERASECYNESLKSIDCRIEKIHMYTFLSYCCFKKLFFLLTVIMNFRFCSNRWSVILKSCLASPHFFIKIRSIGGFCDFVCVIGIICLCL